jgi:hypothetical protein
LGKVAHVLGAIDDAWGSHETLQGLAAGGAALSAVKSRSQALLDGGVMDELQEALSDAQELHDEVQGGLQHTLGWRAAHSVAVSDEELAVALSALDEELGLEGGIGSQWGTAQEPQSPLGDLAMHALAGLSVPRATPGGSAAGEAPREAVLEMKG